MTSFLLLSFRLNLGEKLKSIQRMGDVKNIQMNDLCCRVFFLAFVRDSGFHTLSDFYLKRFKFRVSFFFKQPNQIMIRFSKNVKAVKLPRGKVVCPVH